MRNERSSEAKIMEDKKMEDSRIIGMDNYDELVRKEAEFWGEMAKERWKGGIPLTMDYQLATRYRVKREALGWGDYIQDPKLEELTPFGRARKKFIEYSRNMSGQRVLDLCCGAGWLSLEHARGGKTVDAVDCSAAGIEVAKRYQGQLKEQPSGKINWVVADLNKYEMAPGEYDLVTIWDGLHHIADLDRVCRQINGALKPGGMFLFSERVWGGKSRSFRTKISQFLEIVVNASIPLTIPYEKRFNLLKETLEVVYKKYLLGREVTINSQAEGDCDFVSPFEDISGMEMLPNIENNFSIERLDNYGSFSEEACRSLNLPRPLRIPGILFLSWFDYMWIKTGLLEGKIIVGYARKK